MTKKKKVDIKKRLNYIYKNIGTNIIRLRSKMSQQVLADKAGVSRSTIGAIEKGKAISLENLVRIADALGIEIADLFISDEKRREVSYMHVLLMEKLAESLKIKIK